LLIKMIVSQNYIKGIPCADEYNYAEMVILLTSIRNSNFSAKKVKKKCVTFKI
jgi:hypothetical protein